MTIQVLNPGDSYEMPPAKLMPRWCVLIIDRALNKVAHIEGVYDRRELAQASADRVRGELFGPDWLIQVARIYAPGEPE